jgi:transcription elongation GreA/GreB family factor
LKTEILNFLKQIVDDRIKSAKIAMIAVQESANNEGKSSAGDKYETGRAMAQIEKNLYQRQLLNAEADGSILERIDTSISPVSVGLGSFVETSSGKYFVSISIGQVEVQGQNIMAISANSPIGLLLIGKKVGEMYNFLGIEQQVISLK